MLPGAETIIRQGVRLARWKSGKGKTKTAPITTTRQRTERIRDESSTYFARYRDGVVIEAATGTGSYVASPVALLVTETGDKRGESLTSGVKMNSPDHSSAGADSSVASISDGKGKRRLTTPGKHSHSIGAAGFEPTTSRPPE
jgi:hypothetical protein